MCQAVCKGWLNILMNKMGTVPAFDVYRPLFVSMNCLLKSLACFFTEENITALTNLHKHFIY